MVKTNFCLERYLPQEYHIPKSAKGCFLRMPSSYPTQNTSTTTGAMSKSDLAKFAAEAVSVSDSPPPPPAQPQQLPSPSPPPSVSSLITDSPSVPPSISPPPSESPRSPSPPPSASQSPSESPPPLPSASPPSQESPPPPPPEPAQHQVLNMTKDSRLLQSKSVQDEEEMRSIRDIFNDSDSD